ncbi:hypothetical protein [Sandarakinorhabdus oryzae]|uniref:hypothetical protein n=1 Tax=Sandarakinorhabdus oryzae TaxID=2675220 RepID=UPI0012E1ECA5|nr:hypothetical protein [Sandarakinorhabdus oryzae]
MRCLPAMLLLLAASPVVSRELAVPLDKGWQHAQTGLILPARIDGLQRTELSDATEGEHDIAAQFESEDGNVTATIFLYHAAIPDVAMWFERSETAIVSGERFRNAVPIAVNPTAFAVGSAGPGPALRQTWDVPDSAFRSTALAVMPLGQWLVAVRLSSHSLSGTALNERLQSVISAVVWPANAAPNAVASVMQPCSVPLRFTKAKRMKAGRAGMLLSLLGAAVEKKGPPDAPAGPPPTWCRDGEVRPDYSVYRANAATDAYIMAIFDTGRVVRIRPSLSGLMSSSGKRSWSVEVVDVNGNTSIYDDFTSLPAPEQAWALINTSQPSGIVSGKNATVEATPK